MPLGEADAMALLRDYINIQCQMELLPPNLRWGEFEHRTMRLIALPNDNIEAVPSQALAWWGLMETLNALACCRGLGLDENPRFWRQCLKGVGLSQSEMYPFHSDLLSRYRIDVFKMENTERVAAVLAICLSKDPTSPAQRKRDDVHAELRRHFVCVPPPLQFELELSWGGGLERHTGNWARAKRTLWDLNRMWRLENAKGFAEKVAIILESSAERAEESDARGLRCIRDVLSLTCVELRQLRVHINAQDRVDVAVLHEIRMLMRELVCFDTLEALSCSFRANDPRCIAAICSALPALRSLRSFSLTFVNAIYELTSCPAECDAYDMWLIYALLMRKWQGLPLVIELNVPEGSHTRVEKALASTNCLVEAIPGEVVDPVFMPHGASAALRTQAAVTAKPFLDDCATEDSASFIVSTQTRVSVIAQSSNQAIVVWPGIGLVWVPIQDLYDWKTLVTPVLRTTPVMKASLLEVFSCINSETSAVVALVKTIGAGLLTLTMS